jgi:hypothetical protein
MNVALGRFAQFGLETRLGTNVRVGVLMAIQHYTRRLGSGWRPVVPPRFWVESPRDEEATTIELQLNPETRARLEQVAQMHQVPLNHVLMHAIFVYLADLDAPAGRG